MARTLLVDDEESLVTLLQERGEKEGVKDVEYFTSLGAARGAARVRQFDRFIADQVFEGEEDDGLTFLEEMKAKRKKAEIVLLTGQPVTRNVEERLHQLGGRLVKKQALNFSVVTHLLREGVLGEPEARVTEAESTDVGELRLEVEALREEIMNLRELNDLLVEDVVAELSSLPDQEGKAMLIGDRLLSPEELRYEVEQRTQIGKEMVRLHHDLNKLLRNDS